MCTSAGKSLLQDTQKASLVGVAIKLVAAAPTRLMLRDHGIKRPVCAACSYKTDYRFITITESFFQICCLVDACMYTLSLTSAQVIALPAHSVK